MQERELITMLGEAATLSKVQAEVAIPDTLVIGERMLSKMLIRLP